MLGKIASHKLMIIGFAAGLALAGAAFFLNLPQQFGLLPSGAAAAAVPTVTPTPTPKPGQIYTIKDRIVNLADQKSKRYLKVSLALQFESPKVELPAEAAKTAWAEEIAVKGPIIDDAVTGVLTTKTYEQVITPEGKEALKEEIREKANSQLGEDLIEKVYLTDFVVQ
jgi:flagellar protein FliL